MLAQMPRVIARTAILTVWIAGVVSAQWIKHPTPGIPRTTDGKPNLTAPVPKLPDGKPDLSGIWQRVRPQGSPGGPEFGNTVTYYMAKDEMVPLRPWAAELLKQRRYVDLGGGRPSERCLPHGVIGAMLPTVPFKLVQQVSVIWEVQVRLPTTLHIHLNSLKTLELRHA